MEKLLPKLRFPEFENSWITSKMSERMEIFRGASPRPQGDPKYYGGPIPRLMIEDATRDGKYTIPRIDSLTEEGALKSRLLPKGSPVLSCSGTKVGIPTILSVDSCIHDGWLGFRNFLNIDTEFLYYIFLKLHEIIQGSATTGGVFNNLTTGILKDYIITIPSLPEQNKIATFLSAVDEKINLLKEKKAALEEYKKGMMQKIFSQEIRFKDDNGKDFAEWENAILSEVVELFHGYQFRSSDFTSNGIAVIKIGNVIGNNLDLTNLTFISENRIDEFKHFEIQNDDILMSLTGNIGRIIEVKSKPFTLLQNYRVGKFVPIENKKLLKPFLKYLLASDLVFGRFSQLANQSAQANFGKQDMDKIFVSFPSINEQTKIASLLSAIDQKIELVSIQIEETQEYKKGLLQQMFV